MRIAFFYGALLGILQVLSTLALQAFGLFSSAEKIPSGQRAENFLAFVLMMLCLSLGLRAVRRAQHAQQKQFVLGFGAKMAFAIACVGGFINALGQYGYLAVINPAHATYFRESIVKGSGLTAEQAEQAAAQLDFIVSPAFRALSQGLTTFLFGLLVGLAYAFIFRDRTVAATASSTSGQA